MNLANFLTFVRIVLTPLIIYLLLNGQTNAAAIVFVVACLSDWFDGLIARKLNQVTELGKFLDPLSDKIIILSVLVALVGKGMVSVWLAVILMFRELSINGLRIRLMDKGLNLGARWAGKVKMVLEVAAITLVILKWEYATIVLWGAVAVAVISGLEYFWVYKDVWK